MEIKNAVRYLRKQKGWTQSDLAERAHTTKGNISNLENGAQAGSMALLTHLAQAFGCRVSDMFALAEHLSDVANGVAAVAPIDVLLMQLPPSTQNAVRVLVEQLVQDKVS